MGRGSARAASRLGISPIVVGLTVVSIGSSMPELAVGVVAASEGSGALAVGNIAGTNVVNAVRARPQRIDTAAGHRDADASLRVAGDGGRRDLVVGAGGQWCAVAGRRANSGDRCDRLYRCGDRASRRERREAGVEFAEAYPGDGTRTNGHRTVLDIGMMLAGIAVVVLGADGWSTRRSGWHASSGSPMRSSG